MNDVGIAKNIERLLLGASKYGDPLSRGTVGRHGRLIRRPERSLHADSRKRGGEPRHGIGRATVRSGETGSCNQNLQIRETNRVWLFKRLARNWIALERWMFWFRCLNVDTVTLPLMQIEWFGAGDSRYSGRYGHRVDETVASEQCRQ